MFFSVICPKSLMMLVAVEKSERQFCSLDSLNFHSSLDVLPRVHTAGCPFTSKRCCYHQNLIAVSVELVLTRKLM